MVYSNAENALGEKFRPAPLLVQYVKAGRLGRKAGRGVYDYPGHEPGRLNPSGD
jgi:3-hydroxyacyl-CoA dehydrogenase